MVGLSLFTRSRRPSEPQPATPDDRAAHVRTRRIAARVLTGLACLLVFLALVAPNQLADLTPGAFLRIPVEGLVGVALVLVLPGRARRVVAVLAGVSLGLLTILKIVDVGFFAVLGRPFDLLFDWPLLHAATDFLTGSIGWAGAIGAVVAAAALAAAVLVLVTLAVRRLTRLVVRRKAAATRAVAALTAVWVGCALLGAQIVPNVPVAAHSAAAFASDRVLQVSASLRDQRTFAAELATDAFRDTPGDRLLTGLRGKDVALVFVETYGRVAIEDPEFGPQVGAVLEAGTRRLAAAGFSSRSAFLTSSTAGGGSWLAHSTLLSGLWIDNQRRYHDLEASDRLTLTRAFGRAGWRTVGIMPGVTSPWPQAAFYGYDQVYDSTHLGYHGPRFSWATMPDQYTLAAFERLERDRSGRAPVMAEIPLVSSHAPWSPIPRLVDWNDVGDGSVFDSMAAEGAPPEAILTRDPDRVRTDFRRSIEYSLSSLISYVETYGDDDLVLIVLGDHQPAPVVTGENAGRDVPITVVARDPAVLDRISGWGWQEGLKPGPQAPVWRMDSFRDRFLGAFGP
ncbi:sulfatase [Pseudonocardia hispaniensis]|uniref:Sulfatase n=1 Tax=Pseudonocardia hispaniensis TaxID=904933 RepID=A0ABW1J6P6_9PSEU